MPQLITSAFRALGSLTMPGMPGILIKSVLITLAALIGAVIALSTVSAWLLSGYWPWLTGIGATLLAWFLFPGIMPVIVNFFDDRIARIIERQDYPAARPLDQLPFWPEMLHDIRFTGWALLLNALAFPLYFLMPPLAPFLFYGMNGYLLGREFFVMVARRYMPVSDAEALRLKHRRVVFLGGVGLAVMATIPIVNLAAPLWGIALMTHLFHALEGQRTEGVLIEG